ncbi:MAG: tRNA dihydrouridine synthase DusB [Deltaproteobacteria bacterium]|nr:tRNA dihydrouridine synthase DusB [Deltaproteobacteria bacterium]
MQLGPHSLANPWILAPMAGVSEAPYRRIARALGAGATPTELVSARGLIRGQARSRHYLEHDAGERPFWVQIFGGEPEIMGDAAACARDLGAEVLDLNMGCPVKKVVKTGAGATLMRDLSRAAKIVEAMATKSGLPVTAKIRSGWDADSVNAAEACRVLAAAGCVAVSIHARTRAQGYSGRADWGVIADAVEVSPIPVIGNGDIKTAEDARARLAESGCAAVMIGRGAMGNPWIFAQLAGRRADGPTNQERLEMLRRHLLAHVEFTGRELVAIRRFRPHLIWYSRGLAGAAEFRRQAMRLDGLAQVLALCDTFFGGAEDAAADEEIEIEADVAFG